MADNKQKAPEPQVSFNEDQFINEEVAGLSNTELEAKLKRLELLQRQQELEYRQYDIELKKEEFAKLKGAKAQALEMTRQKNTSLRNFIAQREAQQAKCNHRKGGIGPEALINGQGSSAMYSIAKHRLPMGDFFVICTRCGKEWMPPMPFNVEGGELRPKAATPGWNEAVTWPTDNTPSVSSTFLFRKDA